MAKNQYLCFTRDTCGYLKKNHESVENLRYFKLCLPFGTGSIIAKNSRTDDEAVVQLENVR